jgi:hypothetical protein
MATWTADGGGEREGVSCGSSARRPGCCVVVVGVGDDGSDHLYL